jgi:hypothetical protein
VGVDTVGDRLRRAGRRRLVGRAAELPRGEVYLSKLGSGGVIDRAADARRKALAA